MSKFIELITRNTLLRTLLLLLAAFSINQSFARNVVVQPETIILPVSANLKDSLGRDKSILSSAAIKDSQGRLAKGMHNIDFSLDASAPYPLVVDGTTVQPGQSVRFSKNLSLSASAVTFSIKPAVSGVAGTASYSMSLPEIKIAVCPEGMTETLNNCQQILFAAPVLGCDAGYQLTGSQCEQTITAPKQYQCATGYTQNGNQCVGGPSVTPKQGCPVGFSFNANNECEAVKYTAFKVCPIGFSDVISHCEKTSTVLKVNNECSAGYETSPLDPNYCILTERVAKSTYCENEENTGAQKCTGSGAQKVCATFDQTKAACEVKTYALTANECGPDYKLINGQCQLNKDYTISVTCPASYTQAPGSGTCEKVTTTAATPECLAGYILNGTTCSKADSLPIESCPAGYYYVNSKCNQMVKSNINCASGYTWNGTICSKIETTPATGNCTSPYSWNGSTCQQTQTATGSYSCDSGSTWNGSQCEVYRKDLTPWGWSCPGNTVGSPLPTGPNQNVCKAQRPVDCPSGYGTSIEDDARCYSTNHTSSNGGACPSSHPYYFVDNSYQCTTSPGKTWSKSGSCPTGYTYSSAYGCLSNHNQTSIGYGESGHTYNSSTYKMEGWVYSSKTNTCPNGYTYVSGTTCQKITTQTPSSYSCSVGWSVSGSNCTRTLTVSETRTCNSGFTIATPDYPTQCYNNTFSNNVGNCKTGYTLSGTTCNGTLSQPAGYECSPGWVVSGDKCIQTLTAAVTVNCASPFTDAGPNCAMTMIDSANNICVAPYQWSATDNKCKAVITTPKL
jgi:hypothetical protein